MQIELTTFKTLDVFKQQMSMIKNKRGKKRLQDTKKQNQGSCLSMY